MTRNTKQGERRSDRPRVDELPREVVEAIRRANRLGVDELPREVAEAIRRTDHLGVDELPRKVLEAIGRIRVGMARQEADSILLKHAQAARDLEWDGTGPRRRYYKLNGLLFWIEMSGPGGDSTVVEIGGLEPSTPWPLLVVRLGTRDFTPMTPITNQGKKRSARLRVDELPREVLEAIGRIRVGMTRREANSILLKHAQASGSLLWGGTGSHRRHYEIKGLQFWIEIGGPGGSSTVVEIGALEPLTPWPEGIILDTPELLTRIIHEF